MNRPRPSSRTSPGSSRNSWYLLQVLPQLAVAAKSHLHARGRGGLEFDLGIEEVQVGVDLTVGDRPAERVGGGAGDGDGLSRVLRTPRTGGPVDLRRHPPVGMAREAAGAVLEHYPAEREAVAASRATARGRSPTTTGSRNPP
jgi:hypothetical protein